MNGLFNDPHIRRILECGERCGMQVHAMPTRKAVFQGFFMPPAFIDTSYFPDPREDKTSEFNAMQKLCELGFYRLDSRSLPDHEQWYWVATPKGLALISEYRLHNYKPQRDPHTYAHNARRAGTQPEHLATDGAETPAKDAK
jgi:hypothetical protein